VLADVSSASTVSSASWGVGRRWGRLRSGPEDTPELDDQRAAIRAFDRAVALRRIASSEDIVTPSD